MDGEEIIKVFEKYGVTICKKHCEATAFNIEMRQLRRKIQDLEEVIDQKNERLMHIQNAVNKNFKA